jgi:hypothetical protein
VPPEIVSILALVVIFAIATFLPINMGRARLRRRLRRRDACRRPVDRRHPPASRRAGADPDRVTYLFAIAQNNGTVDLLVRGAVRLVGGHVAAIPWIMFFVTAVLTAIGALSPAAVAIIAPIALTFAARHGISPLSWA